MSRARNPKTIRSQTAKNTSARIGRTPGPSLTEKNLNLALCLLLAVATFAIYTPVLGHSFLALDDRDYVTANPHIQNGLSWTTIRWAFTSTEAANWHPLTWLSHAVDCQFFGLNAAAHHADNLLIHCLNAVALFLLLRWMTRRTGPSCFVAALFALHPLDVESVAWIAERKNVLSTLLFFGAIAAYAWYARKPGWRRYLLTVFLFAAGLMAKPMVITLPFVLLLLDYWPLQRIAGFANETPSIGSHPKTPQFPASRLLWEKLPMLLLSAASAWITLQAQRGAVRTMEEFSLVTRMQSAVVAYGLYLWKMLWPARLAFYPHSLFAIPAWQWISSAFLLIAITAFVITFRSRKYLLVGWLWFLGTLIPVIGLVQVGEASMADRYAYVPLIGIFVMISFGFADLATSKSIRPLWLIGTAFCLVAGLASVSYRQLSYWESDYDLWAHTLELAETPLAHNSLGVALMSAESEMSPRDLENFPSREQRMDAARVHFERALEMRQSLPTKDQNTYLPDLARTLNNLGNLDRLENRLDEARQHYGAALEAYRRLAQKDPDGFDTFLAASLGNVGRLDRLQNHPGYALQRDQESLAIQRKLAAMDPDKQLPNVAMTLDELGRLEANTNLAAEAREYYAEALKIHRQLAEQSPSVYLPDLAMTLNEVATFDANADRPDEARQHYEEGLKIWRQLAEKNSVLYLPDLALALNNLGNLERNQNRIAEAIPNFESALAIYRQLAQQNPTYLPRVAGTLATLAFMDRQQNRIDESRSHYEEALLLFQNLEHGQPKYAADVVAIQGNLQALRSIVRTPSSGLR